MHSSSYTKDDEFSHFPHCPQLAPISDLLLRYSLHYILVRKQKLAKLSSHSPGQRFHSPCTNVLWDASTLLVWQAVSQCYKLLSTITIRCFAHHREATLRSLPDVWSPIHNIICFVTMSLSDSPMSSGDLHSAHTGKWEIDCMEYEIRC